jgi:hypothetical protein
MSSMCLAFLAVTTLGDFALMGTQIFCPASCGKLSTCSRAGLAPCKSRLLALQQLRFDGSAADDDGTVTFGTAAQVLPAPAPRAEVLGERQYSAVDRGDPANARYFLMAQPVVENVDNVTSVGPPRLFVASSATATSNATVSEIALHMAIGGGAVPPMEAIAHADQLLGVGLHGELYQIVVVSGVPGMTLGAVSVLSAAMWAPPALLVQGLVALNRAEGTLYALAQMPQLDDMGQVSFCGSTHGLISCPVSFMSFDVGTAHAPPQQGAATNLSSLEFCFKGDNNVLGCQGTNVQRMWWDGRSGALAAVTRSPKTGPAVSSIDVGSAAVTTVYRSSGTDVLEFVSARGYFTGVNAPNPCTFNEQPMSPEGNSTVYVQLRDGSSRFLLGVGFPSGTVTARFDLPKAAVNKANVEPFVNMEVI